uniref:Transmembrane protein 144 n=1 Tax=Cyclopterus lumpus TaxID=8103 RepID=A0A8C2XH46_CYCLU
MHEANYSPLLLFVTTLLVVSCHSTQPAAQQAGKLETLAFNFNSTNATHLAYGIAANVLAALLYGSNFVPVKRIETGDGMFFQWVYCASIWSVSMFADLILQSPKFYPFAMFGGVLWATGIFSSAVPIVKAIGLSLGSVIWSSSCLLIGWASTRFGWFGNPQDVPRPMLNYCGAGLCLLSGLIFFFVKTDVDLHPSSESIPLLLDRVSCLLAVVSGLLYGFSFAPILYIKSHSSCPDSVFHGASDYGMFYSCCGIFVASTVYFAIYCAVMNNRPRVYSRAVLPGLFSGLMWASATYCWFLANNYLSAVISFPIVSAGYGLVAALWGTLVFREIKVSATQLIMINDPVYCKLALMDAGHYLYSNSALNTQ